jgi:hypothetical protein
MTWDVCLYHGVRFIKKLLMLVKRQTGTGVMGTTLYRVKAHFLYLLRMLKVCLPTYLLTASSQTIRKCDVQLLSSLTFWFLSNFLKLMIPSIYLYKQGGTKNKKWFPERRECPTVSSEFQIQPWCIGIDY